MATIITFESDIDAALLALASPTTEIPNSRFSESLDDLTRGTVYHQVQVSPEGQDTRHSANLSYELATAKIRFLLALTVGQSDAAAGWSATPNLAAAVIAAAKPAFFEDLASVYAIAGGGEIDASEMSRDGDVLSAELTVTVALIP